MTAFNQSRIKMFRRCQKQYSFRYDYPPLFGGEKGQEMVPRVQKVQLHRGTWLHALQQAHHQAWAVDSGFDPAQVYPLDEGGDPIIKTWPEVHQEFVARFDALFEEEREELGDLPGECNRLFRAYVRRWHSHDSDRYRVAALEDGSPAIEFVVTARLPSRDIKNPFKGRIDLMVEDLEYGDLWIWDAKWVKTVPAADERMMSPQSLMYVWALRGDAYNVRGFVFNYGRTKAPTEPPVLKKGLLTTRARLDTDYVTYLTAIKRLHGDAWKNFATTVYLPKLRDLKNRDVLWFRRERIPVETDRIERALSEFLVTAKDIRRREKADVPRTYTYACKFGCEYHDICCAEFQGLDIEPLVKAKFTFEEERYAGANRENDLLHD